MSTVYTSIPGLGTPPVITAAAWKAWYLRLLAFRLAECPTTRTTTVYFSQAGNDSTGDGSIGNPYKTLAKAQTICDASSGDIALMFRRGDQWRETKTQTYTIASSGATTTPALTVLSDGTFPADITATLVTLNGGTPQTAIPTGYAGSTGVITFASVNGTTHTSISFTVPVSLSINKNNVTVGAYGTVNAAPPQFTAWNAVYNANNFSRTTNFPLTWQIAETKNVAGFREESEINWPYIQMTSIADVDHTPGSWYWDGTNVYMHQRDNFSPKSVTGISGSGRIFQVCYNNAAQGGVYVNSVDGTRIDGIWIDGYGFTVHDPNNFTNRGAGLKGGVVGTQAAVVSNCIVSWTQDHCYALLGGNNLPGSIVTYYKCKAHWHDFVSYTPLGGQECICHECECVGGGSAPTTTQPFAASSLGSTFISHTSFINCTADNGNSGNSTILTGPTWIPTIALAAGRTVTLIGGTPETKTITSYDPITGRLVFTTNQNGTLHTSLQNFNYDSSLMVQYRCKVRAGRFRPGAGWYGAQNGKVFAYGDLASCRNWVVDCMDEGRPPVAGDENFTVYPLSSALTGGTSATLTALPATGYVPKVGLWIELGGGTENPEMVLLSAYNSGTGVMTLSAATPIVGLARTWMRYAATLSAAQNMNFSPSIGGGNTTGDAAAYGLFSTAIVNCRFKLSGGYNNVTGGFAGLGVGNWVGTVFLNTRIDVDYSFANYSGASAANIVLLSSAAAAAYTCWYNCHVKFRLTTRQTGMFSGQAGPSGGTASPHIVMNSILSAEFENTYSAAVAVVNSYSSGGGAFAPGIGNVVANQFNNCYNRATFDTGVAGYSNDTAAILSTGPMPLEGNPAATSSLRSAFNQLVMGVNRLEYDADWTLRDTTLPSIGPLEPLPSSLAGQSSGGGGGSSNSAWIGI